MDFDPEKFLNTPLYAFDQQAIFSSVLDFLEFSERNIETQKAEQLHRVEMEMERVTLDEPDWGSLRNHYRENVLFLFDVVLPMRVRYSALASLVGTIE
jgi:hypothetical protein